MSAQIQFMPVTAAAVFDNTTNRDLICANDDFPSAARALLSVSVSPTSKFFHCPAPPAPILTPAASEPDTDAGDVAFGEEMDVNEDDEEEEIFPDLPPVLHGYPAEHVRAGIVRAWACADAHGANAEKAFFVADLGEVSRQHERWELCLPGIEPFYGAFDLDFGDTNAV